MDLSEILNKTKKRSEQIKNVRKPPSIASTDRPYSASDISKKENKQINFTGLLDDKTGNKPTTNWQQTGNKLATDSTTNWQQTGNKKNDLKQTGNKPTTKPATDSATNWQQTGNKLATNTSFSMLVGLQRNCLYFVYQSCKSTRSKVTEQLSLEHIAQCLKTSSGAIKTTLQRLVKKGCLMRIGFKNGRGGWSTYELPESIFTEMLRQETNNKLTTNWQQTGNKLVAEPATEPATAFSSSSSNFLNSSNSKTTTTVPEEFDGIDIEPLRQYGFTEKHLIQIIERSNFTKQMIQDSLDAFAFDLKKNNKAAKLKSTPLDCIMGTLTKGRHYNPPENYISPQQESARQYLEAKKAEKEKEKQLQEEAMELAFSDWKNTMSDEEIETLIDEILKESPDFVRKEKMTRNISIYNHYKGNIWPQKKNDFFNKITNKI
jgi:predicted transcriptional regulator